ncbi:hypothetical protein QBC36DRAFT_1645 [Triangularia setosa]|uniref:Transmembrane protein n=1 Tax=Triangularia setosa TaxID=2587417 RepID=A0AAN6WI98_9PEZI|nr:hypothetical protein QBC36DRAFT_1645 [Podospora setosa]
MRPRIIPTTILLLVSSGLALCAPNPNPRPIPGPEADPNVDSNGDQITLSSEGYYSSGSGVDSPPDTSARLAAESDPGAGGKDVFSGKAATLTDDGKRLKYLDRGGMEKEYDALQELKLQLQELKEKVKERERWFGGVVCPDSKKGSEVKVVDCASPACVFSKVFTTAAKGLKKRSTEGGKCWEGTGKKEFPLPPWRGGHNGTEAGEGKTYNPPVWIRVLYSGVLEVLVIVLGVGLAVLSWGLMKKEKQGVDEERQHRRGRCCGLGWRRRRQEEEHVEEREKLAGFGEHEHEEWAVNGEEEPRFEIGSEVESEDEVLQSSYTVRGPHYQQEEEAERRVQAWAREPGYESESEGMVADGIYTVPRPTFGQEDRERQLREQDLAARQRYAASESGSDTLAGTRSPSEVDSLEGVSMSQELAAFRDAFGLVEDLVASVEQRRRQI